MQQPCSSSQGPKLLSVSARRVPEITNVSKCGAKRQGNNVSWSARLEYGAEIDYQHSLRIRSRTCLRSKEKQSMAQAAPPMQQSGLFAPAMHTSHVCAQELSQSTQNATRIADGLCEVHSRPDTAIAWHICLARVLSAMKVCQQSVRRTQLDYLHTSTCTPW